MKYANVCNVLIDGETVATFEKFHAWQAGTPYGLLITNRKTGVYDARYYQSERARDAHITMYKNRFLRVYG